MKIVSLLFIAVIFLTACKSTVKTTEKPEVLAENMNTTIKPGEDVFMYANGGWIKTNPIPNEESQWGIGNLVIEENARRLRGISEKAAKENAAKGTASQKIGDFWETAMDS